MKGQKPRTEIDLAAAQLSIQTASKQAERKCGMAPRKDHQMAARNWVVYCSDDVLR